MRGKERVCQTAHTKTEVNQGHAALSGSKRGGEQDVMSAGETSVLIVPDHSGKQLNTVQDGDKAGTQNAKFSQKSQT